MADIDVSSDLSAVTEQIKKALADLQELDSKRQTLAQQIQNLNGVAMYLRGKESPNIPPPEDAEADE